VLGSPLAAIAHLIAVLGKQAKYMPLQANEMVTTGTITSALSMGVRTASSSKEDVKC
jgi:hypothetical protein